MSAVSDPLERAGAELVSRFCTELTALGGEAQTADSEQEAAAAVLAILQDWKTAAVALPGGFAERFPELTSALSAAQVELSVWGDALRSPRETAPLPVGLVVADWAIADTGTLVFLSTPAAGRSLSLLPPAFIALVPPGRLVATRQAVFAAIKAKAASPAAWPTGLSFVTGPSRTADIEGDLSIGVHGPGKVAVIMLPQA
jgi:L-lactate dehydrogenase complex protein LldG